MIVLQDLAVKMSMFAEATKKAASARFKQPQLDAEGQQIEVMVAFTKGGVVTA